MPCGVKWGTPRSGALGGRGECNFLPQTATLLPCGVKIVCYFRRGFATPLKVDTNKKRGIPIKIRGVSHPLKGFYRGLGVVKGGSQGVAIFRSVANDDLHRFCCYATHLPKKRSPSPLKKKKFI
ncbi:hypothetical protein [Campylobacter lanienae]|uniref:hypothetical protein n=1 Tax=Campylobacter lanienae TaxID=75658 RepID=UPI00112FB3C9|nr:hypothetical protein [Campylobacter lanienae]